ncbi:SulP family sulfate permease [Hoeflea halophila]|uniref:SulP family sulfate permease n=1 Tax=Hoeflea halophila TaxID=714899 RepID=A0A286IER9_9HYPH|nr:cyclic nucleotide-binding domain-containing protein [Hoeflea halophila]SOE18572.1 SulP family sulfate permease [Hoeflea halophila]
MTGPNQSTRFGAGMGEFGQSILSPKVLFSNLTAAIIIAILNITAAVSVGALVFSGELSPYLSTGIGLFLVGNAITALLLPIGSQYKANIASTRAGQAPIFAGIAAAIAVTMQDQPIESVAATAVTGILVATIISALVMFALGWARLGGLARYIPFPVMGGFFAGLGYLTGLGGVVVALGPLANFQDPLSLLTQETIALFVPALVFAVLLLVLEKRITHWLFTPVFLVLAVVVFYAALLATGTSLDEAVQGHWLPYISGKGQSFFPVITLSQLELVDWYAVLRQSAAFAVLAMLSVIMLLLDVSGVEIVVNRDLDPNRELKTAGAINFAGALGTGALAFQSLADTAFAKKLGGDRFIMIAIYVGLTLGVIFAGPAPIAFVPNFILGGLLLYVGLSLLIEWIWKARKKLPLSDYIVVIVILLVIAGYGILEGVAAGIALATILFVHRYSRLSVVRASMTGAEYVTKTDRLPADQAYLDSKSAAVRLFVLQGFLFFGSASRLLEQIKTTLDTASQGPVRYLVIDFRRVDAMDTSAVNSFAKLMQICRREAIGLALCNCSTEVAHALDGAKRDIGVRCGTVLFFKDLEDGVGWCNDEILAGFERAGLDDGLDAVSLLESLLGDRAAATLIRNASTEVTAAANRPLFRQTDPGDALYLILKGSVSILLDQPHAQSVMVRTMREGSIFGEMALYTGAARSASAVAREACVLLKLDKAAFERLQTDHPHECGLFHTYIVQLMADRIARANREIVALTR